MKVAIPITNAGFEGPICEHFGHSEKFAIVDIEEQTKQIKNVEEIPSIPHEQGGCMRPVILLKNKGIQLMIVVGMGRGPYVGCMQNNIIVMKGIPGSAKDNIELLIAGKLQQILGPSCNH